MEGGRFQGGLMRGTFAANRKIKRGEGIAPSPCLSPPNFLLSGVKLNVRNETQNGSGADRVHRAFLRVARCCGTIEFLRFGFGRAFRIGVFLAFGHETLESCTSESLPVLVNRVRFAGGIRSRTNEHKSRGQ
jgi:hypothetical protein